MWRINLPRYPDLYPSRYRTLNRMISLPVLPKARNQRISQPERTAEVEQYTAGH